MRLASFGKVLGIGILLMAGVAVASGIGAKVSVRTESWRYKVTVEVQTPEGLKSGSAVREVTVAIPTPQIQGYYDSQARVKGEAVAVDLGKRGVLFAIMGSDDYYLFFNAFPVPGKPRGVGGTTDQGLEYYTHLKNSKAALDPQFYPMFVRFDDLNDPKSVKMVVETDWCMQRDENGTCIKEQFHVTADRFEELFGKGVKLKDVTIETTDEPVTWGIEKWLPWLKIFQIKGERLNGSASVAIFTNDLSDNLGPGSFQVR